MYPLDDDNLDHLSREAAEHFEVEAGASGWDHLEQRLNVEMPQEKKRRRFLFWIFLITLTTGGALTGILTYHPVSPIAKNHTSAVTHATNTTQQDAVTGSNNHETPVTTAPTADKLPVGSNEQSIATATNTKPGISTSKPATGQPAITTTVTVLDKPLTQPVKKTTTRKTSKQAGIHIQKTPATLNYATIAPGNGANRPFKPAKQKAGKRRGVTTSDQNNQQVATVPDNNTDVFEPDNRVTNDKPAITGKPVETNRETPTAQPTTATTDSAKNKIAETPVTDSAKTAVKPQKKADKIQQPLEFGVMVGPDMSAVAFGPLYKAGYNFGLQVSYRFSNRWSVNAGAIYTKKFYKTDSSHFEYKNNPWPNNKTISTVEGNCSMW